MKIPKTLGGKADKLYELRAARLAEEKKIDAMKKEEEALREAIFEDLRVAKLEKASGKVATVSRVSKTVGKVTDWQKFYAFIRKNDAFELLQRRVNDSSYRERLDAGERVDGVEPEVVASLNVTKAGS